MFFILSCTQLLRLTWKNNSITCNTGQSANSIPVRCQKRWQQKMRERESIEHGSISESRTLLYSSISLCVVYCGHRLHWRRLYSVAGWRAPASSGIPASGRECVNGATAAEPAYRRSDAVDRQARRHGTRLLTAMGSLTAVWLLRPFAIQWIVHSTNWLHQSHPI